MTVRHSLYLLLLVRLSLCVTRYTVDGEECDFPLVYRGTVYSDCFEYNGKEQCQVNGEFKECATADEDNNSSSTPVQESSGTQQDSNVVRYTVNGDECEFPVTYRGGLYYDCFEVGGVYQCQVNGNMEECAPVYADTNTMGTDNTGQTGNITRYTVDGQKCEFPTVYRGGLHYDCFEVGGVDQCQVNGNFEECAPVDTQDNSNQTQSVGATRYTVTGNQCQFPVTYRGEVHYDCFQIGGIDQCQVNNENFEECVSNTNNNTNTTETEESSESSEEIPAERYTIDGEKCEFPIMYRGGVHYDCFYIGGVQNCQVNGKFKQCLPSNVSDSTTNMSTTSEETQIPVERYSVDGDQCQFPTIFRGSVYYDCFDIHGMEKCKISGQLVECQPLNVTDKSATNETQTPALRFTVNGNKCQFPTTYRGGIYYDCIEIHGVEQCNFHDQLQECLQPGEHFTDNATISATERYTVDGEKCEFPFIYRGGVHYDCIKNNDMEMCQVDGEMKQCEGNTTLAGEGQETPAIRYTVDGERCEFPVTYRGQVLYDCFNSNGTEQCLVGGQFKQCRSSRPVQSFNTTEIQQQYGQAPDNTTVNATVYTIDGRTCQFPFTYRGSLIYECIMMAGKYQCMLDNKWIQCQNTTATPETRTPIPSPTESSEVRMTTIGKPCDTTYIYKGEKKTGCIIIGNQEKCEVQGILYNCVPIEGAVEEQVQRFATTGEPCDSPFMFEGQQYTGCVDRDGKKQCQVRGVWNECLPVNQSIPISSSTTRYTVNGNKCIFPFTLHGVKNYNCVLVDDIEKCAVQQYGLLEECAPVDQNISDLPPSESEYPPESLIIPRTTLDGQNCVFPFIYFEQTYYDCTTNYNQQGNEQCLIDGSWFVCQPLSGSEIAVPLQEQQTYQNESVAVLPEQQRITVDGFYCDLPFTYRGVDYYDCLIISGKEHCWMDNYWYECEPVTEEQQQVTMQSSEIQQTEEINQQENNNNNNNNSTSISSAGVAAIIISVVVVLAIIALASFYFINKRSKQKQQFSVFQDEVDRHNKSQSKTLNSAESQVQHLDNGDVELTVISQDDTAKTNTQAKTFV